ncbi:zinc-binding dehydrogenase [Pseudodesulfovibrio sp. F-1]|uniref:Zinc-binding dehydrogenase n=1 Tax=Pseudodesulfovibrio alkaliphilus TaxID=2661613 RepID=A0A7K1KP89_9BACT|nr:zinc-dependent alcohol dehydrogenase family protein [Pseudodesulfovibrio alkaliphilus]MUM77915.1 zinc-binding dehydrogenase [Pseudodesulfovibrio alkaliphilus]
MKAMVLERFGEDYAFVEGELPLPEPGQGEVLVRVAGSSLNPIDHKIATLGPALAFAPELPAVPGMDVSGTVEAVGPGVIRLRPGDRVFGCAGGLGDMPGALAEFMVADADLLAQAPQCMDLVDAAALPLVSITAWLGLFERAHLAAGQTLLVHGGAGGVGHVAVQLGVHAGAEVFATVSGNGKADVVEALGATPIDYRATPVDEYVAGLTGGRGFDVVFDTVGGAVLDASFLAAAPGGQVVSVSTRASHDLSPMHARGLSLYVVFMLLPLISGQGRSAYGRILEEVAALVDDDVLAVLLDERRFHFTEIAAAHRHWAAGNALGKVSLFMEG